MGAITMKMHDIIKVFYQTATTIRAQMAKDRETYIQSIADDLCEKGKAELLDKRNSCLDSIYAVRDEAVAGVREWAQIRGSDMTDDAKLLDGRINLTAEELAQLIDRYKGNYTMSRMIADYWQDRHKGKDAMANLALHNLATPEKRIEDIERLAAMAAKTIQDIYDPNLGDPIKNNLMEKIVEGWGEGVEL